MGSYRRGDVVLARVPIRGSEAPKLRPAVVLEACAEGDLVVCPVSQKPSFDSPFIPLGLPDFARGGLDLFTESYVLTSLACRVKPAAVIGKKGVLRDEVMDRLEGGSSRARR